MGINDLDLDRIYAEACDNQQCFTCKFYYRGWAATRHDPGEPSTCVKLEELNPEVDNEGFDAIMNEHWELAGDNSCPYYEPREVKAHGKSLRDHRS